MTGDSIDGATAVPLVGGRCVPAFQHIEVEPLSGACGCEIRGVDLTRPLTDEVLAEVMRAFEHFLVIVFRAQHVTLEQHKAFSRAFGELMQIPQAPIYGDDPEVQEVRREAHESKSVVPSLERFHTDSPFLAHPPRCVVMRAMDVPRYGGDTAFTNAYMAYDELSAGLKRVLEDLRAVYSGKEIWRRNAALAPNDRLRLRIEHDLREDELESVHPAVRSHPRSGRKGLYVTQAYFQRFEGWSAEDSKPLVDYLQAHMQTLHFQCRVRWKRDTVVVWDNRFLFHRGVHDFNGERRHLVRTTVRGERPR